MKPANHAIMPDYYEPVSSKRLYKNISTLIEEAQRQKREAYKCMTREARNRGEHWPYTEDGLRDVQKMLEAADALYLRDLAAVISMSARDGRFEILDIEALSAFRKSLQLKHLDYTDDEIAAFRRDEDTADHVDWLCDAEFLGQDFPSSALSPKLSVLYVVSTDIWLAEYRLGNTEFRSHVYVVDHSAGAKLLEIYGHHFPPFMYDDIHNSSRNFVFIQ